MDRLRDDHRDDQMPYGVDTIRLRIEWPAAPAPPQGYNGRAWKMRPLRGWTGGQAAGVPQPDTEAVAPPTLPISGSETMKAQRGQAFGGVAQGVRFTLGAQQGQGAASGEDTTRQSEPSSRNDAGLFRERYQTAVDQALAALAAVNALSIGQRFAANTPKANNDVFDVQFTKKFDYACRVLGVDRNAVSDALHAAKNALGLRANQNCEFDLKTGDTLWQGEVIGNLFDN